MGQGVSGVGHLRHLQGCPETTAVRILGSFVNQRAVEHWDPCGQMGPSARMTFSAPSLAGPRLHHRPDPGALESQEVKYRGLKPFLTPLFPLPLRYTLHDYHETEKQDICKEKRI